MEVKQQVYDKFMKDHGERWLTDTIPALDGMTPVEAVKLHPPRHRRGGRK